MEKLGAAFFATGISATIFAYEFIPKEWVGIIEEKGVCAFWAIILGVALDKMFLLFIRTKEEQVKTAERREFDISGILDSERTEARRERKEQHEKMVETLGELTKSVDRLTRTVDNDIAMRAIK